MRFKDGTSVFCLSCVLFFFYVSSLSNCPPGFFGSRCNYKCRCVNESCDDSGECTGSYNCMGGWFGPACQYADLAFGSANDPVLVDGDDSTCISPVNETKIILTFKESFIYTWCRIHVRENGSDTLVDMIVTIFMDTVVVDCDDMKKQLVDNMTLDKHCELNEYINKVTLDGEAVDHLCSVYVSGGRNVAVKEKAEQSTVYSALVSGVNVSFNADRAVDGDTDPQFFHCSCTSTDGEKDDYIPTWTLFLSKKRLVNKYVLYNRETSSYRLQGFSLQSFDTMNKSVVVYKDNSSIDRPRYSITHKPRDVRKVVVIAHNDEFILTLCEVEVYGDSICDAHHYGRDCELDCYCPYGDACFVSTGGCPIPCRVGYHGPGCFSHCPAGTFGDHCNSNCSHHCEEIDDTVYSPCNPVTGLCVKGCRIGYSGATCENECSFGMFGDKCNSSCSPACAESSNPKISPCNHVTGACSGECKEGFTGVFCERASTVGFAQYLSAEAIIGISLAVALIIAVGFACFSKKNTLPVEEWPVGDALSLEKEGENIQELASIKGS